MITGASSANTLDQMAAATLKGNATGGWALGRDLTGGQVTAMLDTFSSAAKGLAPASSGGTTTYLRADGTWAPIGAEWSAIIGKPSTLSGYGITDGLDLGTAQTVTGAKTFAAPVGLNGLTSDPASPSNGSIWYNAGAGQLKAQVAGVTQVIQPENDIPWLTPVAGELMTTTSFSSGGLGSGVYGANGLRLFPFTARAETPITGLVLNVTNAVVGSLAKFIVYGSDANGRPDALLAETADVDCSSTGPKTAAVSLTLRRGQTYWLGLRVNGNATVSAWVASATPDINGGTISTGPRKSLARTLAYVTPAPATWGWTSADLVSVAAPAVWLQV